MNTTTNTAAASWDASFAHLSGLRSDISREHAITIGKSYAEEDAERAALRSIDRQIAALGPRP